MPRLSKSLSCSLSCLFAAWAITAFAKPATVTVDQLAKPPASARHFAIVSRAGMHGRVAIWTSPDGTRMERSSLALRGLVTELESRTTFGPDGMVSSFALRGFTPGGDASETFRVADGAATWKSQVDAGSQPYASPAYYISEGGGFSDGGLVEALLAAPDRSLALLPGGRARMEHLVDRVIDDGDHKLALVCWAISGLDAAPILMWTTADGKFWGFMGGLGVVPVGHEADFATLKAVQAEALAARSPAIAHALAKTPSGPVAFTHVRAFVDGTRFVEDQTVVMDRGTITVVGRSSDVRVPDGARTIDGADRTLVPGLWDSHQHMGNDFRGPHLLALGITSVRDPGNDDERTRAQARRRATGDLLMPRVYPSAMIDGKGPNTAQIANVATSLDEARAVVRRAAADRFTGVKLYGSFDPAWVAPTAAEAHRLGLHVHGHLPAGMRTSEAIDAGYDEITHIYFVMMEAMPDDVVKTSNGIGRFVGVGRYARGVDLAADPMKSLIASMRMRHVAVDPTLVVAEGIFVPESGDLSDAYRPYTGTLPPVAERGFRGGGFEVPADLTRADFRASFGTMLALVGALHKAGVRIVAGTDGSGLELVRELELYVQAGFTPEEALASATIEAARNVGVNDRTGSIAVGKAADLVLVEGDPSRRIGDLRNTRLVVMDGQLMDADELRRAAGFSGRPHGAK